MVKISAHFKMSCRFGMHFSARGLVLDYICSEKYEAFFTIARPFLDTRKKIHEFFWYYCVFKMKLNNFLVGSFLIGIGLVIGFQLQSEITQILESFSSTNTL